MRYIKRAYLSLLSEMKLAPTDWLGTLNLIQTALNEAFLNQLCQNAAKVFMSPLEVMTGLKPIMNKVIYSPNLPRKGMISLDTFRAHEVMDIKRLQKAFKEMHKDVMTIVTKNRLRQIKRPTTSTKVLFVPLVLLGDFVLV